MPSIGEVRKGLIDNTHELENEIAAFAHYVSVIRTRSAVIANLAEGTSDPILQEAVRGLGAAALSLEGYEEVFPQLFLNNNGVRAQALRM